jgi:hypothetical protein
VIPIHRLREVLEYSPESGEIRNRVSRARALKGAVAGNKNADGYLCLMVDGKMLKAHRVAWCLMTGEWPTKHIDHIDGDKRNNSWLNLRQADAAQNAQNIAAASDRRDGLVGVSRATSGGWRARIKLNYVEKHLGVFDSEQEAHAAYLEAKRSMHTFNPFVRE